MRLLSSPPSSLLLPSTDFASSIADRRSILRWPHQTSSVPRAALAQAVVPPMDSSDRQRFTFAPASSSSSAASPPVKEKVGRSEELGRDTARVQNGNAPSSTPTPSSGKDRVQNSNGVSSRVQGLQGKVDVTAAQAEVGTPPLNRAQVREVRAFARTTTGYGADETALNPERPLPLPMTFPGATPLEEEEVQKMLECDPEIVDCPDVVYQWTDKCERCFGTGFTDVRRKKGKATVGTCLMCSGLGYSQRFTIRDDIPLMGDGSGNGKL